MVTRIIIGLVRRAIIRIIVREVGESIANFLSLVIAKGKVGWHALRFPELISAGHNSRGHRQFCPPSPSDTGSRVQGEEPVAALGITCGAKADGPNCMRPHVIGVLFMGLHICTGFKFEVFAIIKLLSSYDVLRRKLGGHIVTGGK